MSLEVECDGGDQLIDMVEPEGWSLAPKAAAHALGAGVDCAGPDAGSMMHTMALGAVSLAVQPPPARPRGVTRETEIVGDQASCTKDTVKYTFHGATHTLSCVIESGLSTLQEHIDFSGILAERLPNGRVVVVIIRPKKDSPYDSDTIIMHALDLVYDRLEKLKCAISSLTL